MIILNEVIFVILKIVYFKIIAKIGKVILPDVVYCGDGLRTHITRVVVEKDKNNGFGPISSGDVKVLLQTLVRRKSRLIYKPCFALKNKKQVKEDCKRQQAKHALLLKAFLKFLQKLFCDIH